MAQFKGTGTLAGSSDAYGFLVSAVDGQVTGGEGTDRFRIKIWNKASGAVVYDNQMGGSDNAAATTAIAGGSILIQAAKSAKPAAFTTGKESLQAIPLAHTLKVTAMPNPSRGHFNLLLQGEKDKTVHLRVMDLLGREVEVRRNLAPNMSLRIGETYRPGVYLAELRQGKESVLIKLVKGSD